MMFLQAEALTATATDSVPLARPFLNRRELDMVADVLSSGSLDRGAMRMRLERDVAEALGVAHAVAVSSGAAALHVAALGAGWGAGDEVITSPFAFVGSANVVRHLGARVVFADLDPQTLNIDPAAVADAVTGRTRGIIAVDSFGWPCDMTQLARIADRRGIAIIEDACEALGATRNGLPVAGDHDGVTVYSLAADMQSATGEGAVLCTNDAAVSRRWRELLDRGRFEDGRWVVHDRIGFDFHLSDVQSAIGVAHVEKLTRMTSMRRQVALEYERLLRDVSGVRMMCADTATTTRAWPTFWVMLDEGIGRDAVIRALAEEGIGARGYEPCAHLQPIHRERGMHRGMFPVAESVSARALALPLWPHLSPQQQARVVDALGRVLGAG